MSTSERDDTNPSNKWILGGGVGLLVAAAVIGFFVIAGDSTDTIRRDPAVTGTVDSSSPPTGVPTTSATTVADSVGSAPVTSTSPPSTPPPTDAPQPTTTIGPLDPPLETDLPVALTTAGSFGVSVAVPEGRASLIVTEPMAFATAARDGRVFMQRSRTADEPTADTTLLVWSSDTDELTPLDPPRAPAGLPDDTIVLHDVATVDGVVTVLYETRPARCPNPEQCTGAIVAWQPDTGTSIELESRIVWEGGWSGLQLAENGLIVGSQFESASSAIYLASISSVTPPAPGDLGLDESYDDCNVCPFAYTIDPSGRFVGWIDFGAGINQQNVDPSASLASQIAVVEISADGGFADQRVVADVTGVVGQLEIADIAFGEGGFTEGRAVFSEETFGDSSRSLPVEISLVSGRVDPIDSRSATLGKIDR